MQCVRLVALLIAATAAAAHPSNEKKANDQEALSLYSEFFYVERVEPADVDTRSSLHPNLESFCKTIPVYDRPTCGETEDGKYYRIVQNDTHGHEQHVIKYECVKFEGTCDNRGGKSIGGSCEQRYRYRLMLAYLPAVDNCSSAAAAAAPVERLGAVQIKLPSHCVCMVRPEPKATRAPRTSPLTSPP